MEKQGEVEAWEFSFMRTKVALPVMHPGHMSGGQLNVQIWGL